MRERISVENRLFPIGGRPSAFSCQPTRAAQRIQGISRASGILPEPEIRYRQHPQSPDGNRRKNRRASGRDSGRRSYRSQSGVRDRKMWVEKYVQQDVGTVRRTTLRQNLRRRPKHHRPVRRSENRSARQVHGHLPRDRHLGIRQGETETGTAQRTGDTRKRTGHRHAGPARPAEGVRIRRPGGGPDHPKISGNPHAADRRRADAARSQGADARTRAAEPLPIRRKDSVGADSPLPRPGRSLLASFPV